MQNQIRTYNEIDNPFIFNLSYTWSPDYLGSLAGHLAAAAYHLRTDVNEIFPFLYFQRFGVPPEESFLLWRDVDIYINRYDSMFPSLVNDTLSLIVKRAISSFVATPNRAIRFPKNLNLDKKALDSPQDESEKDGGILSSVREDKSEKQQRIHFS